MYTRGVPSLLDNLRALPRPAWVLFAGTFVNRFGTFVMPFLAIYMTRLGYSPTEAGIAVSAYGGGHAIASLVGGHLADRIGRRHTIALSMLGSAFAMMALSQARTFAAILALAFLAGALAELYRPAAAALLADLVTPEQRVAAFGMYRFAINLGFAAGPATAGFLADHSFLYLFIGDAATSFVYGLVALVALPHGIRSSASDRRNDAALRHALSNRPFVFFLAATLCAMWVEFQLHATMPLHVTALGFSTQAYGVLLSINGVMIILFELLITAWTQRVPPQPVIAAGYALSGIGVAMLGIAQGMPMLVVSVVVWTIGEMVFAPVTGAYVAALAPERLRGRYMGLWHMTWSAGMLIAPITGTWLYERSPAALWTTTLVMGLAAGALALVKPGPRTQPAAAAQEPA